MRNFKLFAVIAAVLILSSCQSFRSFIFREKNYSAAEVIHGAGATFPGPLYDKWAELYGGGGKLMYEHVGSGNGVKRLMNLSVDFGGSDAFLSDDKLAESLAEIVHIPSCLGAVVLTYNLNIAKELKLTPEIISGIYLGKIKKWNHPLICNVNREVKLPDLYISVVHRAKKSGTTYIFTNYLSKVSQEWKEKVGCAKKVEWPLPLGIAKDSNEDIAHHVKKTIGGIGYVQLNFARKWKLPVALIRNNSGNYVRPTLKAVSEAANVNFPYDTRIMITNTNAVKGYPISGFTWILLYKEQYYNYRSYEKSRQLVDFLNWMNEKGQKYNKEEYYAPLPDSLKKRNREVLKTITYKGSAI